MVQGRAFGSTLPGSKSQLKYLLAVTLGDLNSLILSVPSCDMKDDTHSVGSGAL